MNVELAQLGGIIRYEALMQFRRRVLIMLGIFFFFSMVALSLIIGSPQRLYPRLISLTFENGRTIGTFINPDDPIQQEAATTTDNANLPRWYRDREFPAFQNTWGSFLFMSTGSLILFISLMPMLAEVISLDRQYKVRELFNTTPLAIRTYLAGKVLGTVLGLAAVLAVCAVAFAIYMWLKFGAIEIGTYVLYWLIVIIPPAIITASFAVLIPAVANSRRVGVIIGLFFIPLAIGLIAEILRSTNSANVLFSPEDTNQFNWTYAEIVGGMFWDVIRKMFNHVILLVVVAIGLWAAMRRQEAR